MIVTSKEMVQAAKQGGYAIPAINTQGGNYDIIRSICYAAEEARSPIILAHYVATGAYSGHDWFAQVCRWLGEKVSVPVAIHLDHGDSFGTCMMAIKNGFTSLMLDCSTQSIEDNARNTAEVIRVAREFGLPVEAEVGELVRMDSDGAMLENNNIANVSDVEKFLSLCTPDMLAIGIGNAHGFYKGEPNIRLDVLEQVSRITDIPLVLHGCTGMPEDTIKKAIGLGIAKINFGTIIRHKYVEYYKDAIDTMNHQGHSWKISQEVEKRLRGDVLDIITLSGSGGKA